MAHRNRPRGRIGGLTVYVNGVDGKLLLIRKPASNRRPHGDRWRERYLESGLQGIERDLPRGAPPVKVDVAKLVELTTQATPEAATHWSTHKMGAALGVSASTVMRHWQAHGLKPQIVRGFQGLARPAVR